MSVISGNARFNSEVFGGKDFFVTDKENYFPIETNIGIIDSLMMSNLQSYDIPSFARCVEIMLDTF
jgi:hypothetical protein